jgi:bacillithiol biosynthesis deacetylase BshB1
MTDWNIPGGPGMVLAIAAHPDDVELCCAGTLMMEKMHGKQTAIVDLTQGELGTRGTNETRLKEATDSLEIMGLDARENLKLPDGFFQNSQEHQLEVIKAIRKYRPDILLTNAPSDRHPDHGRAASLVKDAAFLSGLRKVETVGENGQPQEPWRPKYVFHFVQDRFLQPSFVFDITPVMEKKIEAIKAFKTQFNTRPDGEPQTYISTPEFLQSIIDRARMFGKMIGVPYAEGFITEKMIGVESFDAFIQKIT